MLNYYELLKIQPAASHEEIELAFTEFKKELLKFSPGVNLSDDELKLRKPEFWKAYEFLLNPVLRKKYDEALERDRIHALYEAQNKLEEQEQLKSSSKRRNIGLIATILIVAVYFIIHNGTENTIGEEPKWRSHYITDEIQVVLPSPPDTNVNIIPPFLMNYIKSSSCCQSDLKGGFSVTVARFVMEDNFKISEKDISYIVNNEMGSHMTIRQPDSTNFVMNIRGYRVFVRKGTYALEGTLRAFENYSLLKGNTGIKIIVAFVPGDGQQIKYAETVFNSLNCL